MAILDHILGLAAPLIRRMGQRKLIERKAQFALAPKSEARIVFLGDSIIEQGLWDSWFPDLPTLNRGIGGECIADVQARLDSALHSPRAVVLMIGTNDVEAVGKGGSVDPVAVAMAGLVRRVMVAAPKAALVINSVSPRTPLFRDRIIALNRHTRRIAEEVQATYIDLWPHMAGPDGAIRSELTTDGLHLTAEGYRLWAEVLRPHLQEL